MAEIEIGMMHPFVYVLIKAWISVIDGTIAVNQTKTRWHQEIQRELIDTVGGNGFSEDGAMNGAVNQGNCGGVRR